MSFVKTPVTCFTAFISLLKLNVAPEGNKGEAVHLPQRYPLRFNNVFFPYCFISFPFHMNSADITLSNAFLPLFFYQVPCCFRAISCKLMVLMALGLHGSCYCCALWAGVGLCVPTGRLCCKHEPLGKDTCQQAPKSLQPSSRTVLFILLDFSERISESKDNTRKWWVFVQREVNPNALFNSIHLSRCQLL